jgi:hypothetical protein
MNWCLPANKLADKKPVDLSKYYSLRGGNLSFSRAQSSAFAKQVAGDFNPIHNPDAKRFCVPGDLLFSVVLQLSGVRQSMHFDFAGMVSEKTALVFPDPGADNFSLCDAQGKHYLDVSMAGEATQEGEFVHDLMSSYVLFSGHTFPDILVDLMQKNNVMINPDRPLVIYKSMTIALDTLAGRELSLELEDASLAVEGKKGNVHLRFSIGAGGKKIGHGEKVMLLGGLREYDQVKIDDIVNQYAQWKSSYSGENTV